MILIRTIAFGSYGAHDTAEEPVHTKKITAEFIARTWIRFRIAFEAALPAEFTLMPDRDMAMPGELYISINRLNKERMTFRWATIKVKTNSPNGKFEPLIVKYVRNFRSPTRPDVYIRARLPEILRWHPQAAEWAYRWTEFKKSPEEKGPNCAEAVDVYEDHTEDMARLVVSLLKAGRITGLLMEAGQLSRTGKRRPTGRIKRGYDAHHLPGKASVHCRIKRFVKYGEPKPGDLGYRK
jgi:hypothetical protein